MLRGIRQGCGLSPLLWLCFSILIHERLSAIVPAESITGFADDYIIQWRVFRAQEFRNTCTQITKIISAFRSLGMEVSVDKTAILLAIKGSEAESLLRDFTCIFGGARVLRLRCPTGLFHLPIKKSHPCLGVVIGYGSFEKATVEHIDFTKHGSLFTGCIASSNTPRYQSRKDFNYGRLEFGLWPATD